VRHWKLRPRPGVAVRMGGRRGPLAAYGRGGKDTLEGASEHRVLRRRRRFVGVPLGALRLRGLDHDAAPLALGSDARQAAGRLEARRDPSPARPLPSAPLRTTLRAPWRCQRARVSGWRKLAPFSSDNRLSYGGPGRNTAEPTLTSLSAMYGVPVRQSCKRPS
jgi:hypothetical protein